MIQQYIMYVKDQHSSNLKLLGEVSAMIQIISMEVETVKRYIK